MSAAAIPRMSGPQRRRQVIAAAATVVARSGFAGTSTDDVARAAGVSQPYVVRMFGGKAALLNALLDHTSSRILETFRAVPPGPHAREAMGQAYIDLVGADRDVFRVLLHGFAAGSDDAIGSRARAVLGEIFELFMDRTGAGADAARDFVAYGMLINVLLAVEAPDHLAESAGLAGLARQTFGQAMPVSRPIPPSGFARPDAPAAEAADGVLDF